MERRSARLKHHQSSCAAVGTHYDGCSAQTLNNMRPATREYLELQLQFASHYAVLAEVGLAGAAGFCTNLRRRFGLEGTTGEAAWQRFGRGLQQSTRLSDNVAWAEEFQLTCPLQPPPVGAFGCFSFDAPDEYNTVRIHFRDPNPEPTVSPLARPQIGQRRDELRAMFEHIRLHHPKASTVRGASWLYNLEAYNRLLPEDYWRSAVHVRGRLSLNGASTWGQVLDWRDEVKPTVRRALLDRLPLMDPEAPWSVFPLQCLVPTAPIQSFLA